MLELFLCSRYGKHTHVYMYIQLLQHILLKLLKSREESANKSALFTCLCMYLMNAINIDPTVANNVQDCRKYLLLPIRKLCNNSRLVVVIHFNSKVRGFHIYYSFMCISLYMVYLTQVKIIFLCAINVHHYAKHLFFSL